MDPDFVPFCNSEIRFSGDTVRSTMAQLNKLRHSRMNREFFSMIVLCQGCIYSDVHHFFFNHLYHHNKHGYDKREHLSAAIMLFLKKEKAHGKELILSIPSTRVYWLNRTMKNVL